MKKVITSVLLFVLVSSFLFLLPIGKDLITVKADIISFSQPQSSHGYRFIPVAYSESAAVSPGSLEMVFVQVPLGTDYHIFLNEGYANPFSGSIDPTNILSSPFVSGSSSPSIPDDFYNVTIRWKRASDSGTETLALTSVIIDTITLPGIIDEPQTGGSYTTSLPISVYLADPALPGSVRVVFHNNGTGANTTLNLIDTPPGSVFYTNPRNIAVTSPITAASASSLEAGNYNMTLTYQDDLGNPASSVTKTNFTIVADPVAPPPVTPPASPNPIPTPTPAPAAPVVTTLDVNGVLVSAPVMNADGTPVTNTVVSQPAANSTVSLMIMILLCCLGLIVLIAVIGYLIYQNPKVKAWVASLKTK